VKQREKVAGHELALQHKEAATRPASGARVHWVHCRVRGRRGWGAQGLFYDVTIVNSGIVIISWGEEKWRGCECLEANEEVTALISSWIWGPKSNNAERWK